MRKGNCNRLLEGSHESFYWLGFLLADAHFDNGKRLTISIQDRDDNHLKKLSIFLGDVPMSKDNRYNQNKLSIMHTDVISEICEKYSIIGNKTEFPVDISMLSEEQLLCLSIGFIDGDGSIGFQFKRKDVSIRIKCHSSWIDNLKLMYPQAKIKINNQGYSTANISNSIHVKELKKAAIKYDLPFMERKWDKIDLNFISKQEKSKSNYKEIEKLLTVGKSIMQISDVLSMKYRTVYMAIRRSKINL